mgnify:CR=1 FL=1
MALPADEHGVLVGKRVLVDLAHEGTAVQVGEGLFMSLAF